MTSELPLVTIITPAYNRAAYLKEVIDSVLDQEYPRVEHIVLDDGSKDNTVEVLKQYGAKIRWESHPNMGETRTVNKGFRMASGDIICVVNSDDPLLPGAVRTVVQAFQESPEALVVYTDWLEIGPQSQVIRRYKLPHYDIHNMLLDFDVAMGPGTFFRRRAFDLIGLRDETVLYTGDLDYWFRLALHGPFVHIPRALATHRVHPDAASSTCKGPRMADELVRLAIKICAEPSLPPELRIEQTEILANAHLVAINYCGDDQEASLAHREEWRRLLGWTGLARYRLRKAISFPVRAARWGRHQMLLSIRWCLKVGTPGSKTVRFLVVSHVLPPSWSGQAVILGRLLSGIDPKLYCLASIKDYSGIANIERHSERLPSRYHLIRCGMQLPGASRFSWLGWISLGLQILQRTLSIYSVLRREQCRVVVAATGDLIDPAATCLAARLAGISFYLHLFDDYTYQWIDPVIREQARKLEGWMMRRTSGIIVPNEFIGLEMSSRHGRPVTIVRNACSRPQDQRSTRAESDVRKMRMNATLLYTGAVYHVNSTTLSMVMAALDHVLGSDILLHVYTAQSKEYLQSLGIGSSRLVLHPHAPYDEVEKAQQRADILLVPFDFDSPAAEVIRTAAPGKLGDYLSSGTPILAVVPPDSFVAWYLRQYECGFIVDKADVGTIAEAIRRLLWDSELRAKLVANAAARASEDFDPGHAQRTLLRALGVNH